MSAVIKGESWYERHPIKVRQPVAGRKFLWRLLTLRRLVKNRAHYEKIYKETSVALNDIERHLRVLQFPRKVLWMLKDQKLTSDDVLFIASISRAPEKDIEALARVMRQGLVDAPVKAYLRAHDHQSLGGNLQFLGLTRKRLPTLAEIHRIVSPPANQKVLHR